MPTDILSFFRAHLVKKYGESDEKKTKVFEISLFQDSTAKTPIEKVLFSVIAPKL